MTNWKSMDDAPKDGRKLLLFARLKIIPDDVLSPFDGFWDLRMNKWKVAHDIFEIHELIPSWWMEIEEPPSASG